MMNNLNSGPFESNCIELGLPMDQAYIPSASLTASSIANNMGFDAEKVEGITNAVSATCNYVIQQAVAENRYHDNFTLQFFIRDSNLDVVVSQSRDFSCDESSFTNLKALVDQLQLLSNPPQIQIRMAK